jgi:hypothetical protein
MPRLRSIGHQAAQQLNCIRPYTPDIIGAVSDWAGFWGLGDQQDTFLHASLGPTVMTNENTETPAQLGAVFPGVHEDFPEVPGEDLNQPWYQPACGITARDLNLADDSEARAYDPGLDSKIVPFPTSN